MSTSLGTQSPPLEYTTTTKPLGKADKAGGSAEGVADSTQRQGYFKESGNDMPGKTPSDGNNIERAQRACLESLKRTQDKWEATKNRPQRF
ncbi:hypothetical protein FRB99_002763 [Tulasnella sp. 403]|nr:hypothetical protein FRB99_002763 [Tulasnella sp. 403]